MAKGKQLTRVEQEEIIASAIWDMDLSTLTGLRNKALVLIGISADKTIEDLLAMTGADVNNSLSRLLRHSTFDPLIAGMEWMAAAKIGDGNPLWPSIDRWGNLGKGMGATGLGAIFRSIHPELSSTWSL